MWECLFGEDKGCSAIIIFILLKEENEYPWGVSSRMIENLFALCKINHAVTTKKKELKSATYFYKDVAY